MNNGRLKEKTGKTAEEWVAHMGATAGAAIDSIDHKEMARIACDTGNRSDIDDTTLLGAHHHRAALAEHIECALEVGWRSSHSSAATWRTILARFFPRPPIARE